MFIRVFPSGKVSVGYCMKQSFPHTRCLRIDGTDQIFDCFAICVTVHRTGIFADRKLLLILEAFYIGLGNQHQRPNDGKVCAV